MKIFKYQVPIQSDFRLELPKGAKIISFQLQNETPMIWAIVNEHLELETRYFEIVGTGFDFISTCREYIGTIQLDSFVWHLFEDVT